MKKILISSLILFAVIPSETAFASIEAFDAGAINAYNVDDMIWHDAVTRERKKQEIIKKEKATTEQKKLLEENKAALTDIKNVTFLNNNSISTQELTNVIKKHINEPMSPNNVSQLRKEIMKYYQQKGFYSVLAVVSSTNNQTGEVVIDIKEGGRNSITVEP